jgi:hypothetical protein
MATRICLETIIYAPVQISFDLSRSIDLHMKTTEHTDEKAIAGRTSGLIELGEFVTWKAKHFGLWQQMTIKISAMESPFYFKDEMTQAPFDLCTTNIFFHSVKTVPGWLTNLIIRCHMELPECYLIKLF